MTNLQSFNGWNERLSRLQPNFAVQAAKTGVLFCIKILPNLAYISLQQCVLSGCTAEGCFNTPTCASCGPGRSSSGRGSSCLCCGFASPGCGWSCLCSSCDVCRLGPEIHCGFSSCASLSLSLCSRRETQSDGSMAYLNVMLSILSILTTINQTAVRSSPSLSLKSHFIHKFDSSTRPCLLVNINLWWDILTAHQ